MDLGTVLREVAELEEGFQNLVIGLRSIIHSLVQENRELAARLEEQRLFNLPRPVEAVSVPLPAPVAVVTEPERPALRILPPAEPEEAPLPRRRPEKEIACTRCPTRFLAAYPYRRKYCKPCFKAVQGERIRAYHDAKVAREVDAELARRSLGVASADVPARAVGV